MLEEFKKFALRGNVVDLAVGVIIGAAFSGIVNSLVQDIIMPIIGAVTGGLDFSNYFLPLSSKVTADTLVEAKKQGAVLAWGSFLTLTHQFRHRRLHAVPGDPGDQQTDRRARKRKSRPTLSKTGTAAHRNPRPAEVALDRPHGREAQARDQSRRRQPQGAIQLRDRRGVRGRHRADRHRSEIAARRQGDDRGILCRCARRRDLADQRQYPGISAGQRASIMRRSGRASCCCISAQINKLPARSSGKA